MKRKQTNLLKLLNRTPLVRYGTALKKAKDAIQKWARMRDANELGFARCISCGAFVHWKNADGSHFINATKLSTCFAEININLSCKHCNAYIEGNHVPYRAAMIKKYGMKAVEDLEARSLITIKLKAFELEAIAKMYTDRQKEFSWKSL